MASFGNRFRSHDQEPANGAGRSRGYLHRHAQSKSFLRRQTGIARYRHADSQKKGHRLYRSERLRCINRMNDLVDTVRIEGEVLLDNENVYDKSASVVNLRRRVGMVFQKPNPFPKSIYENVAYGLRIQGIDDRKTLDETVENALLSAALWDEVKGRLHENALSMSGGQQQRLVIARAIAIEPEVLLDEPASALDPISTLKIEELINELKKRYTIVIATHNMQQAARVSDYTAFMDMGKLIEFDNTSHLFTNPSAKQTEDYITGRYG